MWTWRTISLAVNSRVASGWVACIVENLGGGVGGVLGSFELVGREGSEGGQYCVVYGCLIQIGDLLCWEGCGLV